MWSAWSTGRYKVEGIRFKVPILMNLETMMHLLANSYREPYTVYLKPIILYR